MVEAIDLRYAWLKGPQDLVIESKRVPLRLGPHDVWAHTIVSALKIGTDRGNFQGPDEGAEHFPGAPDYPRFVGDSNCALIKAVGSEVTHFAVGERIVTRWPHQSDYIFNELTGDGVEDRADQNNFGDLSAVLKVPPGVAAEDAVWAWLWTLSQACYQKSLFRPGETVAVVGLGTLGMGCIALGPLMGARVIGIANSEIRAKMARKNGAHATFLYSDPDLQQKIADFTHGDGVDLVILTANPFPAHRTACEIVRNNGRVGIVALTGRGEPPPDFNPLDMSLFYSKGISLVAISGPEGDIYPTANGARNPWECGYPGVLGNKPGRYTMQLIEDGGLRPSNIITHRLSVEEIPSAYDMIYNREKDMLGVIFQWDLSSEVVPKVAKL